MSCSETHSNARCIALSVATKFIGHEHSTRRALVRSKLDLVIGTFWGWSRKACLFLELLSIMYQILIYIYNKNNLVLANSTLVYISIFTDGSKRKSCTSAWNISSSELNFKLAEPLGHIYLSEQTLPGVQIFLPQKGARVSIS